MRERAIFQQIRWRQLWLALLCFGLPFLALPIAHSEEASTSLWQQVSSWPGDDRVRQMDLHRVGSQEILYAVGAVSGLHVSANQGQSWLRANMRPPDNKLGVLRLISLASNPLNYQELYAIVALPAGGLRPMVYWSQDSGQSWQVRGSLGPRRIRALAFGPQASDLYMIGGNGVFKAILTVEGRPSFVRDEKDLQQAPGFPLDPRLEVTTFDVAGYPRGDDECLIFYVGTAGQGVHIATGHPETGFELMPVEPDLDSLYVRQQAHVHSLCYHPLNSAVVCVGTERGIYASADGGASWFRTAYALRKDRITASLFDPLDNTIYVGVAGGGVQYSLDLGIQWKLLGQGLGKITPYDLTLAGTTNRVLYAATNHGIWRLELDQ